MSLVPRTRSTLSWGASFLVFAAYKRYSAIFSDPSESFLSALCLLLNNQRLLEENVVFGSFCGTLLTLEVRPELTGSHSMLILIANSVLLKLTVLILVLKLRRGRLARRAL